MTGFFQRVEERIKETGAFLCVGLDPRPEEFQPDEKALLNVFPDIALYRHGKRIIESTAQFVCAWKPNLAFYERWGSKGWSALEKLIPLMSQYAPVILDGKRGDIGSTAEAYAASAKDLGVDCVTLSPYLGRDAIDPFIEAGLDVFLLLRTSNPSATEIQDQPESFPLWKRLLQVSQDWASPDRMGYVIGATVPEVAKEVRQLAPDRWMLLPGIGSQGASITQNIREYLKQDNSGLIVPISRAITGDLDPRSVAEGYTQEMKKVCQNSK